MGRKRIDPEDRKENVTIRLPRWMIDKLRESGGVTNMILKILNEYFRKKGD